MSAIAPIPGLSPAVQAFRADQADLLARLQVELGKGGDANQSAIAFFQAAHQKLQCSIEAAIKDEAAHALALFQADTDRQLKLAGQARRDSSLADAQSAEGNQSNSERRCSSGM
jgi:hypothetical protein